MSYFYYLISIKVSNSDIPDWCFSECGIRFDQSKPHPLNAQEYEIMFSMSPDKVSCMIQSPVLLMLGEKDRRVPYSQGLKWGQYLKSRKVDIR